MAEFIPDRLPSRASKGEERTFALLKKLPDDYLVYYEPNIDNLHPDFIVIAPDLGVIIIEVKGWYLDDIIKGDNAEVTINYNNLLTHEVHPLEQARNYQWRLAGVCKKSPMRSMHLQKEGKYENKFIFPSVILLFYQIFHKIIFYGGKMSIYLQFSKWIIPCSGMN